jgi:thiol-disulfide isomerase/thioredoxin
MKEMRMRRIKIYLTLTAGILLLAGCAGGKQTPTETATTSQSVIASLTAVSTEPGYPFPSAAQTQPANPALPVYPYPMPEQSGAPAPSAQPGAYPNPGQAVALPPVQLGGDPTVTSPYPAPGQAVSTPPTQAADQAPTLPVVPSVYPAPLTTQVPVPTIRPTRDVIKELHATDPRTVQLASGKVQLVEFFAFWDGTSKALAPIVHGLEAEYGQRMNFIYLDIDDPATKIFKSQLGYRYQPNLFLLDEHGSILKQWLGYVDEADLRAAFDAALN